MNAPRAGKAARLITAPGLLLGTWCVLVAALFVVRHLHPPLRPTATPSEIDPASTIGATQAQRILIALVVAVLLAGVWVVSERSKLPTPVVASRTVGWRLSIAATALGVSVLVFLMFFQPLPNDLGCSSSMLVRLNPHMGFIWSCDSWLFQDAAKNPSLLLHQAFPRQDRPVYTILGSGMLYTIGQVVGWLGFDGSYQGIDIQALVSLDLLNVLVLMAAAVLLVRQLLAMGTPIALTAALATPLVLNDVTTQFTFTPHQQTFAMLVPVVTVLMTRRTLLDPPRWHMACWWGLALGVGALAYGSFVLTVPVVVVALCVKLGLKAAPAAGAFVAGFAAPQIGWIALCRLVVGSYYNHEVTAYRQFVWVLDSLRRGPGDLWRRSASYLLLTLQEIIGTRELWVAGAVIGLGIVLAVLRRIDLTPGTADDRATLSAVAWTAVVTVLFLWGIGYYTDRLSTTLLPLLLIVAGWVYSRLAGDLRGWTRRLVSLVAAAAVLGWLAFILT